eukprot:658892-Amorphochlora_amoeboformis.AAC.2
MSDRKRGLGEREERGVGGEDGMEKRIEIYVFPYVTLEKGGQPRRRSQRNPRCQQASHVR